MPTLVPKGLLSCSILSPLSDRRLVRSWLTTPSPRSYLTPAFGDLVAGYDVKGPFHPYIPCAAAAQQPREYLIREPLVVNAPLACVWCAGQRPHPKFCSNLLQELCDRAEVDVGELKSIRPLGSRTEMSLYPVPQDEHAYPASTITA